MKFFESGVLHGVEGMLGGRIMSGFSLRSEPDLRGDSRNHKGFRPAKRECLYLIDVSGYG